MSHHHHHEVKGKNLFITVILNIIITLSQIVGGIYAGSLALLSDAIHNFSDVLALLIAWWANYLSHKPSTERRTYGYKRAEILAALFNSSILIGIAIFLVIEAINRFIHPVAIESNIVIWLGVLSIVLNSASVLLIKDDSSDNMNIKAAYLHLLTDVVTSIAVVVGGVLMLYFHIFWIDSIITLLIAIYLIKSSIEIVKESIEILMQSTPADIDIEEIESVVRDFEDIENIHHLHIWRLDEHTIHLEAHLDFAKDIMISQATKVIEDITQTLHNKFEIEHCTFQAEYGRDDKKDLIY